VRGGAGRLSSWGEGGDGHRGKRTFRQRLTKKREHSRFSKTLKGRERRTSEQGRSGERVTRKKKARRSVLNGMNPKGKKLIVRAKKTSVNAGMRTGKKGAGFFQQNPG